jgi:hypothetical protein
MYDHINVFVAIRIEVCHTEQILNKFLLCTFEVQSITRVMQHPEGV